MRIVLALLLAASTMLAPSAEAAETRPVPSFGPNPGRLTMHEYVPKGLPRGAPLVVVLHGCTQGARDFDDESGWTALADRHRFALLLPEQAEANNDARCFNFFSPAHNRRGQGEAASIMAMVEAMRAAHGSDPSRTFVTGLSAGGAMTAVMLASYPEAFRAGAIIAGVPYGCASTGGSALLEAQRRWWIAGYGEAAWAASRCGIDRTGYLRQPPAPQSPGTWRERLGDAGAPPPPAWPKVSLWQGREDRTVHPRNLDELVDQWTAAHGVDQAADREEANGAYRLREYKDAAGDVRVQAIEVFALGHAVPVDPGGGPSACGRAAPPYFVASGVCAAGVIARFWGLDGAP